ncbi:hypothetical protein [Actinocorallia sp. A-T 12471]|uniref:hypothetical protein n=1 Tax=Actinocorallia sp. A-T 12471 TaxID=3089813 RepID=UPI0029CDC466|nr:hypothetical protein [Actinocorallia sp. A-T 12471]MDX6743785.1 hypothetical protein [Actinocorallia sp. A-T 12471]
MEAGQALEEFAVAQDGGAVGQDDVDAFGLRVHRDADGGEQQVVADAGAVSGGPGEQAGRQDEFAALRHLDVPAQGAVPAAQREPAVELGERGGRRQRDRRQPEQDLAGPRVGVHPQLGREFGEPVHLVVRVDIEDPDALGAGQVAQETQEVSRLLAQVPAHGPSSRSPI